MTNCAAFHALTRMGGERKRNHGERCASVVVVAVVVGEVAKERLCVKTQSNPSLRHLLLIYCCRHSNRHHRHNRPLSQFDLFSLSLFHSLLEVSNQKLVDHHLSDHHRHCCWVT